MRKIDDTNITQLFKKELNKIEMYGIEKMVESFDEVPLPTDLDYYGFVYSSTGSMSHAIYGVTETVHYAGYYVDYFAITENGMLIMACWDDHKEIHHYYEVESNDLYY